MDLPAHPTGGRDIDSRTYNNYSAHFAPLGDRGFALLVGRWRILRHIIVSPSRIGQLAQVSTVIEISVWVDR